MCQGLDAEIDARLNDVLSLHKPSGEVFEDIRAHVSEEGILITDTGLPIEANDRFIRKLPSSVREAFIVKDLQVREAIGGIPAHFHLKVKRAVPPGDIVLSLGATVESPDFWRARRDEFGTLGERQRSILGDRNHDHEKWFKVLCRGHRTGEFGVCPTRGGFDGKLIGDFNDIASQAAVALGCPPGIEPKNFWLHCLSQDVFQNPREEVRRETWGSGIIYDLLGSSAGYCLRLAVEADRQVNDARHQASLSELGGAPGTSGDSKKGRAHVETELPNPNKIASASVPDLGERSDVSAPEGGSPQFRETGKKRGRHRDQERRDAIRNAITKYGDAWRDRVSDVFKELDSKNVPLGDFLGREIDLGDGDSTKVSKWDDLDLAQGEQRRKIVDALRKYL